MKFLVDAHLPRRLYRQFESLGYESFEMSSDNCIAK